MGGRATIFGALSEEALAGSPWRATHGGRWDVGPHALSLILPVLGPVARVAAADGPHATTHLLLTHTSGAVSTLALSLRVPPAATAWEVSFYGAAGWVTAPTDGDVVEACARAVGELVATAAAGRADHPCGVQFGREVVEVLASADRRRP